MDGMTQRHEHTPSSVRSPERAGDRSGVSRASSASWNKQRVSGPTPLRVPQPFLALSVHSLRAFNPGSLELLVLLRCFPVQKSFGQAAKQVIDGQAAVSVWKCDYFVHLVFRRWHYIPMTMNRTPDNRKIGSTSTSIFSYEVIDALSPAHFVCGFPAGRVGAVVPVL